MIGLYLHLPFCLSKCAYCDFASQPLGAAGGLPAARRYLEALHVELDLRAASAEFSGAQVETIYLGGGTPTVLPAEWQAELLTRVRYRFGVAEGAEVTVEANPGTVDRAKVAGLLAAGVNRVSLGVQSFSDDVLRTLGRVHDSADAVAAIEAVRAAGCLNLNLDLIYAAPGQSLAEWEETLGRAVEAGPEHISTYGLSVEEGTPLSAAIERGELDAPDDALYAEMYAMAGDLLTRAGSEHYEISSFARAVGDCDSMFQPAEASWECRHNRRYWANHEYLGLGASAHSFRGGLRWNNLAEVEVYTERLEKGLLPVARAETLSPRSRVGEMLMLGLRRGEGVREDEIGERCGLAPRDAFGEEIEDLCQRGLLMSEGGRLWIERENWLISNEVLARFVG